MFRGQGDEEVTDGERTTRGEAERLKKVAC